MWLDMGGRYDYFYDQMASLHKDPRGKSPFWYCAFYRPDGSRAFRSTKERNRTKALRICLGWDDAARQGKEKRLTEAQVRRVLSDIMENATGEKVQFYSTRSWLEEWLKNREGSASATTMQRYKQVIRDFLEHLGDRAELTIAAVTHGDVVRFRDKLKVGGRAESTVNNTVKKVLNVPFAAALKLGIIPVNPVASVDSLSVDKDNRREPFTSEQISSLLTVATDQEWRGVILTGLYTGLRLGDIKQLTWGSIDLDSRTIRLRTRKTKTKVVIPIHPELESWLALRPRGIGKAPVFPSMYDHRTEGAGGLSAQFRKLLVQAKIVGAVRERGGKAGRQQYSLSFHSLRHSFVSNLAASGIAPDIRMRLAGHASDEVHDMYTHHSIEALRGAVEALPRVK